MSFSKQNGLSARLPKQMLNSRKKDVSHLGKLVYLNPDVVEAGKNLLGLSLFTKIDGCLTGGVIIETESYAGIEDKASHAYGGRLTKRTEVMYRQGGIAYVYLCYGIHALLNVVTGAEGVPHAVLIRAIHPTHGTDVMLERRKKKKLDHSLVSGPGALTAALGVTTLFNGQSLDSESLWIADFGIQVKKFETTPRIGIDYAEEWATRPYRFVARELYCENNDSTSMM